VSESADYVPVRFLLPRIKANYFSVNVWRSKTLSYICYVNNDKQTHNDMTIQATTRIALATELAKMDAIPSHEAEYCAHCMTYADTTYFGLATISKTANGWSAVINQNF